MNFLRFFRQPTPSIYISYRMKSTNHWAKLRKHTFPRELAMQHFDNFYGKVYNDNWKSMRLGLLTPSKHVAVVNIFGDNEETERYLSEMGCIDLETYYKRHHKKHLRYRLRMKILNEKKEKKRMYMAQEAGVAPEEINLDDVVVSDVSDSEIKRRAGTTTGSEAEDFVEMFETELESKDSRKIVNQASTKINLNDFVPATEMNYQEEIVSDRQYYEFYQSDVDLDVKRIEEDVLEFPETLRVMTFPRRELSSFPQPKASKGLDVYNYYLMDGSSILPVLVLGIKPKDIVGDFCSAPGGKAMAMLQTLRPAKLICHEKSIARMARLKNVVTSYVPKMNVIRDLLELRNVDAKLLQDFEMYDKILLDVPCTNDRHSVNVDDNNMFKSSRVKERVALPAEQCQLLVNALKCLKPGGSLVYSTCSLSPIQNDGVVHMALKQLLEESEGQVSFTTVDLKEALRPLRGLFRFHRKNRYGTQVLPFLPSNFGPMYFCKIIKS